LQAKIERIQGFAMPSGKIKIIDPSWNYRTNTKNPDLSPGILFLLSIPCFVFSDKKFYKKYGTRINKGQNNI